MRGISFYSCALGLLVASPALAVPAFPGTIDLKNSDGTTVRGRLLGDERLSWAEDAEGHALVRDPASGTWQYAVRGPSGALQPGGRRPGRDAPPAARHLAPDGEALRAALAGRGEGRSEVVRRFEAGAAVPNLVLLVAFNNRPPTFQPSELEPVFNGETGSLRSYYLEVSYGTIQVESTIVGWIPLPGPDTDYAYGIAGATGRPARMLSDAITWLAGQGFDFTPFDADQDGYIDAVDVIHSGTSAEFSGSPTDVWSHYASLNEAAGYTTPEGLVFYGYHTEGELNSRGGVVFPGVICHETGHFFGLWDLYDYTRRSAGVGLWSLMASGSWGGPGSDGSVPTHPDAFSKQMLGVAQPAPAAASLPGYALAPAEREPVALRVETGVPGQYFLLENRQRTGQDAWLPGAGLLVLHVDEDQANNNDASHYQVDVEQADGRRDLNGNANSGDAQDVFPAGGADAFTPFTTPSSLAYGASSSRLFVTGIRPSGDEMAFDLQLADPLAQGEACAEGTLCPSGLCADGVCCDAPCEGACQACSVARGASADGTCTALDQGDCDDGDACTEADRCQQGRCLGTAKACPGAGCIADGACDPTSGACLFAPLPDGAACRSGDACSTGDRCRDGACISGEPIACPEPDACHLSAGCDHETGACLYVEVADGTACPGGACSAGRCGPEAKKGCGCGVGGEPALGLWMLLGALPVVRRRPCR